MSSSTPTFRHRPEGTFTPPPRNPPPSDNGNSQPKTSSLYLFTFLSTLFLLLVVSAAIVLRSFLLRRRYRLGLQEQFDDIFRPAGEPPMASRRKTFGAKPKLWDTWIKPDDGGKDSVRELAEMKPLAVTFVPQETTKPKDLPPAPPVLQPEEEPRHERPSAFLTGLFARPPPPPQHVPENDHPRVDSTDSTEEITHMVQVSVVISMPTLHHKKLPTSEEEFPNVAIGFTRLPVANE